MQGLGGLRNIYGQGSSSGAATGSGSGMEGMGGASGTDSLDSYSWA